MDELISVVIPIFNVQDYVITCVKSVLNQTYENIEIILIDDGSTDKSGLICDQFYKSDSRVRVIHKTNGGLSDARNTGTLAARGKYIVYVDGDDVVDSQLIEYLYRLIVDTKADIGICDLLHCYPTATGTSYTKETLRHVYSSEEAICEMLYQKSFLVSACGKIFPIEIMKKNLFTCGILFEDSAVMYKIFDGVCKIAYGNAKLYGYRHREGSITTRTFSIKDCGILDIDNEIVIYFASRSNELKNAASAYQVTGALRVLLNAADDESYKKYKSHARSIIAESGKSVMHNKNCRKKIIYALWLYFYTPFLMSIIYRRINRWK